MPKRLKKGLLRNTAEAAVLAALYAVTGTLDLMVALPPGNASPIIPRVQKRLAITAITCYSVYAAIVCYEMIFSRLILDGA